MKNAVIDELTQAVKGLLYVSETESELQPFCWEPGPVDAAHVRTKAGAAKGTAVEESSLEDFFRVVSAEEKPKFAKVAKVLRERLSDIKVFKVGDEAERQVFVVGSASDGKVVGLRTVVVET